MGSLTDKLVHKEGAMIEFLRSLLQCCSFPRRRNRWRWTGAKDLFCSSPSLSPSLSHSFNFVIRSTDKLHHQWQKNNDWLWNFRCLHCFGERTLGLWIENFVVQLLISSLFLFNPPTFTLFSWSRQSFPLEFSIKDWDFLPVNFFFFQSYFLFAQSYTITCWVFRAFYHKMEVWLTTVFCSILVLPNWISALLNKILIRKKSDTFFFIFIHTKWPTLNSFCFSCRNMD